MRFDQTYNQQDFLNFLGTFLPDDFVEKEEDIVIKKDRYKEITKARILGFSESLDLHVLEMDHSHEHDSRIAIATDAFKVLADHWIHKALVVFKNKDSENYRLSYLTISLDLNDKNRAVKRYSNARRYSFYLGVNAKIKTPEQQLIKKGKVKDAEDLLSRFSVEVVNKQFYLEVAKFFDELVSSEDQNLTLPGVSQSDTNTRKSFAVRLIGRTMFCWFLKQKKSDNGQLIPDGLLSSKIVTDNYYHNTLEPLFFGVLNTSIESRDIRSDLFDKVPYLNGGLFNPQSDDYYELDRGTFASKHINTLKISDSWFRGFFELLETYNFTIDENTVFDQELSVDPEMLGRIFENLLAEINPETGSSERKRTGSFYTPRQIVEYMVDQSLIEYLKTKTGLEEKKLSALVSYDLTDDTEYPLNDSGKEAIINAVESLKILDPACGSGAYPIGALQKIVYVLQQIDPDCKMWLEQKLKGVPELYKQKIINEVKSNPFDYTRKLDVIKNSIFGVDIQPIAVDVSRLRCFLTLVVESEVDDAKPNRGIEPLPNLDFKFVCANTLIGLPKSQSNNLFEDHSGIIELSKVMSEYFSCNSQRKNEIRIKFTNTQRDILNRTLSAFGKNIGELTQKLTLWDPFSNNSNSWFDPEWMFGIEEKFDIVIGNPPYIASYGRQAKNFTSEEIQFYIKNYKTFSSVSKRKKISINTIMLFFEKGLTLLKDSGSLSYIIDQAFLNVDVYFYSRKYLIDNFTLKEIVTDLKFPQVIAEASILRVLKSKQKEEYKILWKKRSLESLSQLISISEFDKDDYQFIMSENSAILKKIEQKGKPLSSCAETSTGMQIIPEYFLSDEDDVLKSPKWHKAVFSSNINKYNLVWPTKNQKGKYITYDTDLQREVRNLLKTRIEKGEKCRAPETLSIGSDEKESRFFTPKIILSQTVSNANGVINLQACIDDKVGYYGNVSIHLIRHQDVDYLKYLLGLINSRLLGFYAIEKKLILGSEPGSKKTPQIRKGAMDKLPIVNVSNAEQKTLIDIVNTILKVKESDPHADTKQLESKIDEAVMDLYGLTEKEKEIIRNS